MRSSPSHEGPVVIEGRAVLVTGRVCAMLRHGAEFVDRLVGRLRRGRSGGRAAAAVVGLGEAWSGGVLDDGVGRVARLREGDSRAVADDGSSKGGDGWSSPIVCSSIWPRSAPGAAAAWWRVA